jgi:hypothetical protein
VANRWQEFQIETKLSHELFISNQTLNAPTPLNVQTGVTFYKQSVAAAQSTNLEPTTLYRALVAAGRQFTNDLRARISA